MRVTRPGFRGPTQIVGGDLAGHGAAPRVGAIQGRPVCSDAPDVGDVYVWDGTQWCPTVGFAAAAIEVVEVDGSPDVTAIAKVTVPSGSLTDNGGGHITLDWVTPNNGGMVPYYVAPGGIYTVPLYRQALYSTEIDNEGTLDVEGYLLEVS